MLLPTRPSELDAAAGDPSFTLLVSATIFAPSSLSTMLYSKLPTPWDVVWASWNFQAMVPLIRHVTVAPAQVAVRELGRTV